VKEALRGFKGAQVSFPNVIHPTCYKSASAYIGMGNYFGPGSIIHTSASIGSFCVVNSSSVLEHDSVLEDFCNVNPAGVVCGGARISLGTVLGANASVRDHTSVAENSVIGMQGAVVQSIHNPGLISFGVPCKARPIVKVEKHVENIPDDAKHAAQSYLQEAEEIQDVRWCLKKRFSLERYHNYLAPSLAKGHVTNDGPLQAITCNKIQSFCKSTKNVYMTSNGTAALHALAAAWEIKLKRRLRWATQSFTFPSSIQGPMIDSIIVDMDENLGGPSIAILEKIVDQIDGIVVTNVFGQLTKVVEYESWCKSKGKLLLLDNAATPIGFVEDGRSIQDIGDGAFVSLHETKPIGRGEGGALFVSDALQRFVHQAINFGFNVLSLHRIAHRYASNWRMSDIAAAAICDHLDRVEEEAWI